MGLAPLFLLCLEEGHYGLLAKGQLPLPSVLRHRLGREPQGLGRQEAHASTNLITKSTMPTTLWILI